ncbi:MAG: hypothetical protein QOD02_5618, partial [Mycobacterium sp.]|nr:hypothetical protein [Mycobacterium sp.]
MRAEAVVDFVVRQGAVGEGAVTQPGVGANVEIRRSERVGVHLTGTRILR